jgi:hypothetical protein
MVSRHTMDMIKRLRTNRALRSSKQMKFNNNNRELIHSKSDEKTKKSFFKTISQKEIIQIKNRLKVNSKFRMATAIAPLNKIRTLTKLSFNKFSF